MNTGYWTGKLWIGRQYQRDTRPTIVGDMLTLQTALLEKRKPGHWLVELIWRWL